MDFKSVNQILNNDKSLDNRNQFYIRLGRIQTFIKFLVQVGKINNINLLLFIIYNKTI